MRAAQTLCVVPHGLLHYVPFAALHQPSSKGPRYLNSIGDDNQVRAIVCAPSATVQFAYCDRKAQSSQAGCLAFGFDGARLAHAEREAATIAQVTGGTMRVGQAATRAELIAQAATFRQIHIACHGRFNPAWPAASSLALADGLLDVTDIFRDLRLDADLVSLSACETGRSHVLRGDELTGMARAFLYAGAASVAVSHWVVDDVSTGLFFAQFYTALAARTQNSRALADAQHFLRQLSANDMRDILTAQGMRRDEIDGYLAQVSRMTSADERPFAHPYFWAPFFVMGDHIGRGP